MKFGVTFYPNQYPVEIWDNEFSKIKKIGFEVVRFAEMAWDWIEPREGDWQFGGLDRALEFCKKYNIKVVLGVPVAQAPQWLVKKHPEILHVAHDGQVHPPYGPRPNACRDNPIYKKYAETIARVLARRYAKHPALYMWQIDNEPNYPPLDLTDNKDFCHCAATQKAFIEWAKKKYGTIEKLNRSWGTKFWTGTFSSFSEIQTPKAGMWDAGNPHIYLDWFRFKSENISKWLLELKKIIKENDKTHKIGTNSFTSIPNRIVDHSTIAKGMDWFGWDIYPKGTQNSPESLGQLADYWRSVCEASGSEFIVSELQGGPNVRWGCGDWVTGKEIKEWTKLLIEHGAKEIWFHNWRPPLFGSETGGFGIMKSDGSPTERLEAIKEIIKKNINATVRSKIAIYYSKDSEIESYQEEGPSRPCPPQWFSGRGEIGLFMGANSIAGAYRLLWEKNVPAAFIFDRQLREGAIPYKTILMTNPYLISRKQFDNLLAFVKAGGIIICESRFGLKDENAHLYEKPLLEILLDCEHLFTEIIEGSMRIKGINGQAYGFRDVLAVKGPVKLNFEDGRPAVIERRIGKGKIIYACFSLFLSLLKPDNKKLLERMKNEIRIL